MDLKKHIRNVLQAAIQARKLGTNMSTVASITDSLLDFQTSIANEVEASVMVGRRLNYQKVTLEDYREGRTYSLPVRVSE